MTRTLTKFHVVVGELADQTADAIVYPANEHLLPGGGLCWPIFKKAGQGLENELASMAPRFCATGDAVSTGAYNLKARALIHAVVPKYDLLFGGQAAKLANAYLMSILEANLSNARSVVFPNLGVGAFAWNILVEATWARKGLIAGLNSLSSIEDVIICCADEAQARVVRKVFKRELQRGHEVFSKCPVCKTKGTPISYGLPIYGIGSRGGYVSGGCCVTLDSPNWVCGFCGNEWA